MDQVHKLHFPDEKDERQVPYLGVCRPQTGSAWPQCSFHCKQGCSRPHALTTPHVWWTRTGRARGARGGEGRVGVRVSLAMNLSSTSSCHVIWGKMFTPLSPGFPTDETGGDE